jgi:hypothetical protein
MLGLLIINRTKQKPTDSVQLSTEIEPILSSFPNIGNIEKCIWQANLIGSDTRGSVPGPSSYWMKGYVFLKKADIDKYKNQYKWLAVESDWKPSLDESILKINSLK